MNPAPPPIPAEVAGLLRSLGPCAATLVAADGSPRWRSSDWSDAEAAVADALGVNAALDRADASVDTMRLPRGRTLYRVPVVAEGSGRITSTLLVVTECEPEAGVIAGLGALASMLATIERLNGELDSMAAELSARYEELNLVYATSQDGTDLSNGRVGLENLVKHCREHLGVSVAALVLPRQHVAIESHDPRQPLSEIAEFLRVVGSEFFDEVARQGRPVVCNEDMSDAPQLARFGPIKLAAAPVRNGSDAVCGVLVMVNHHDAVDFRNSDRNLLASIAAKAATLVERSYDSLTGLLSRREIERRLDALLPRCRESDAEHAVLLLDVDELRVLNETLGPEAGDAVLQSVARHVAAQQRPGRLAARLDADDFALLIEDCPLASARTLAEDLCASIRRSSLVVDGQKVAMTVSIGVAAMDRESESTAAVLHAAELASAAAHEAGRDRVHVYEENAASLVQRTEQMRWVGRIHNALRANHFRIFGQLIQPLVGAAEPHVEVLLRLVDDDGALHSPGSFLPAAERYYSDAGDRPLGSHTHAAMS